MSPSLLRKLLGLIVILGFAHCSGISGVGGSATGIGDSGGDTTSTGADTLSDAETGLFGDGPVDIPVTIAKLESPNSEQVFLTTSDITPQISSPQWRHLTADTGYSCDFAGNGNDTDTALRAIADPATTPYVYLYNTTTTDSSFATVGSDGSFTASLPCEVEDDIYVMAATTTSVDTAQGSSPLIFSIDELGTVTVSLAQSESLNDSMPFGTSPNGYLYFSVTEDAGTYAMWRRSFDGALPVQTLTGNVNKPLLTRAFGQDSGGTEASTLEDIMFLDSGLDAEVGLNRIREGADASFTLSAIDSAIGILADPDEDVTATKSHAMYSLGTDRVLVVHPDGDGIRVMKVYWTDGSGAVETVIGPGTQENPVNYESLVVEPAFTPTSEAGDAIFVVAARVVGASETSIYNIDMTTSGGDSGSSFDPTTIYTTAWDNKEIFKEHLDFRVMAMGPSSAGLFLFAYDPATQGKTLRLITPQGEMSTLYDITAINPYPQMRVDLAGNFIIICEQGDTQATMSIAITEDIANGFAPFTSHSSIQSCNQLTFAAMESTGYVLLNFFTQNSGSTYTKLSFINLTTNEITAPYFVEP